MRSTLLIATCVAMLASIGCQPADRSTTDSTTEKNTSAVQPAAPVVKEPTAEPEWPVYTEEQTAAAKQMVTDLGVAIKEDAQGNVISVNTAANRSWVDNYQMEEILAFPRLTSLTVEGPSIDDALAPKIAEQAGLESLSVQATLVSDEGIAQLTALKFLKAIDLRLCSLITDTALETLSTMPELRAVRASGTNITDSGVAALLKLPRLTELDLRNCRGVTKAAIQQLAEKKTLRMLKIGGEKIDDHVLEVVSKIDGLTGLSLDNCSITNAGVAKLAGLPLVDFTIYQCANITDEGVAFLAEANDLTKLTLRDVAVQGSILSKLPKPEKLLSLNLGQSKMTDAEIGNLAGLTNLETLVLSQTDITDACVDKLAKLTKLKRLMVTETGITTEGVEKLQSALPECQVQYN